MEILYIMSIFVWLMIIFLLVYIVYLYNKLVKLKQQVDNGWSQIDVQLKRRYDLIPNLVEIVKGYAEHEKETLQKVIEARSQLYTSKSVKEQAQKNDILTDALKSLFAVVENYPNLKADLNFRQFQEELTSTENKISYARQFYNDSVMEYNTFIHSFPVIFLANILKFREREYFETETQSKEAPKVKF